MKKVVKEENEVEIDESYTAPLKKLLSKDKLKLKDFEDLEKIAQKVWIERVKAESEVQRNKQKKWVQKSNELLKLYADVNNFMATQIVKSPQPSARMKHYAADKLIVAFQKYFEFIQKNPPKKPAVPKKELEIMRETESPYYLVKKLIVDTKILYDELSVECESKNDYFHAFNYYFMLGEVIVKEISYALTINDWMLYDESDVGFLYYSAGHAFLKAHRVIKDRYITIHYSNPISAHLRSAIADVFGTGNQMVPPEQLAINCFDKASEILRKTGNRVYYLKCKDILNELKSKNRNFEFNITRVFTEICKNFTSKRNIVINKTSKPTQIQEEDIRDYFLSHIQLLIADVAVAENTRTTGYSDLTIIGRDYQQKVNTAVSEFKVWGRNSKGKHSYKTVVKQLKKYLTDFESFGIVVMINPNQMSIAEKYTSEVIEKEKGFIARSIEEPFSENNFVNIKSKHFLNSKKNKPLTIYHFIINLQPLFAKNE